MSGLSYNSRHYADNIANLQRLIERAQGNRGERAVLLFKAGQVIGSTRRQAKEEWLITTSHLVRAKMLQDFESALYLCAEALEKSLHGIVCARSDEYLAEALIKCDLANDINAGVNV